MSIQEGSLIYFPPDPYKPYWHSVDGRPIPPRPTHCPICGRVLVYHEWNDWPVYPVLRCDGWINDVPGLRRFYRWLEFHNGRHYTFVMPPEHRSRKVALRRFDPVTGKRLGGPDDGE